MGIFLNRALNPTHAPHSERFHALDATRAFALLLGVVFHAAWSFIPRGGGAPITDVSSHVGFDWFFFTSHTFRMQVFFLIAGFFGRMMYHKRGFGGFTKNRVIRIGVPLIASWLILVPLTLLTWVWAGNLSGKNLTEVPLLFLLKLLGMGLLFIPWSMGGFFTLAHLWFLYYLLWIYVFILGIRFLLVRLIPERSRLKERTDRFVAWCVESPWSMIWLTLVAGLYLWRMNGWMGVDTPVRTPKPSLAVLLLYGSFFAFGWLMHRQTHLLRRFSSRWRWQLILALILSVGLYGVFNRLTTKGLAGRLMDFYPALAHNEVVDWTQFLTRLTSPHTEENVPTKLRYLWEKIPATSRASLLQMPAEPTIDERLGVCQQLNRMISYPELFEPPERGPDGEPLPLPPRLLKPEEAKRAQGENRQQLEQLFEGILRPDPTTMDWFWPGKLVYSLVYAVIMWLLVFATLGFFQARCTDHSPAWRYVADSSYWVYLAHIPLVPWLHVWMAHWPWPGLIKFLLLNLVGFFLLYTSYHFLVRSTFIGKILNGRKYPFVLFPWRSSGQPPTR